ncbi:MAG: response regulator [Verrucomicrobia bacterium]|nr:response regulator [Verrucomicrobiota bacterium]
MSLSPSSSLLRLHPLNLSLGAGALGFALNAFNLTVFGGTGMAFGGFVPLAIALSLGPWWGLLSAAIASSRTLLTWGHPQGFVLFSLEALVVGWMTARRGWRPLRADLVFWIGLGGPAAAAFTWLDFAIPFPGTWSIALKMPTNGLIAALLSVAAVEFLRPHLAFLNAGHVQAPTSLRSMLFQRFGIHAALPISLLGLMVGHVFDAAGRSEASENLANAAVDTAEDVAVHLDQHRTAISALARLIELTGEQEPRVFTRELAAVRREYPGFLTLLVADRAGRILATAADGPLPAPSAAGAALSVADRDYFRMPLLTRRSYVSDVFQGRGLGRDLIVAISAPVTDANDVVRFVVEGSLNLSRMTEALGRTHSTATRDLVVTDRRHRVVCATGSLLLPPLTSFSGQSLAFAARTAEAPVFVHDQARPDSLHPERHLATQVAVPGYNWNVYLQEPVWRSQRPIAVFYLTVFLGSISVVGASLILARGTAAVMTGPLEQVVAAARGLAAGVPTAPPRATVGAPREIAQIGRDLHAAASHLTHNNRALEETNAKLRELARNLDQRVQERTAELEAARAVAESASRAKSEFLASMSHELRTPLSVILGNASLLEDRTLGPLQDRQADSIRAIDESGRHLLSLINDLLDLSKIEAGMLELDYSDVHAVDLAEASLRLVRAEAEKKSLTLLFEPECERSLAFAADQRRVKQILVNLLGNAVKFTPAGGRVRLGITVDPERAVAFQVTDTGIGIATELQPKLFRPFVQIDSRLSREFSGTGLGLALVKQLCDLHGGSVSLESSPGKGSTFSVSLPLRRVTLSRTPFPGNTPAPRTLKIAGRPRILVAEDHATNIAVLQAFFLGEACEPVYARDGVEAIERAFAARPDIILMDVQMPRMDGLEAIRRLRADPRTSDVPIICLTALAMAGDRQRCLDAGANEFLCKPCDFQALTATINHLLGATKPTR